MKLEYCNCVLIPIIAAFRQFARCRWVHISVATESFVFFVLYCHLVRLPLKKGQVIIFARATFKRAIKTLIVLTNEAPTDY